MTRAHFARKLVIGGWAAGLLITLAVWSGSAKACIIFVKSSIALSATVDQCIVDPTEEEAVSGRDPKAPADDDIAAENLSDLVLWSSSENRLQALAGRHSATGGVGADVVDMALSDADDDPAPGRVPGQQRSSGLRLALGLPYTNHGPDRAGLSDDDALWQAAKYVAHDVISPDGDIAAIIRLGAEAIHALDHYSTISLGDDAASTGLRPANPYQPVNLAGDAVDTGLRAAEARRSGVGATAYHEAGSLGYYLTALHNFVFSRDGVIAAVIILVGYIAITGLQSLMRSSI